MATGLRDRSSSVKFNYWRLALDKSKFVELVYDLEWKVMLKCTADYSLEGEQEFQEKRVQDARRKLIKSWGDIHGC